MCVPADSHPLVSIIIPAYNADRYISETLDSLLAQSYPRLEIIVVDDGSTDRTRACVLSYGHRVRYLYEENSGGCSKPRNEGIRAASGPLLAFIDADDVMAPDRIAREVDFLLEHPEAALVFSNYQDFTDREMVAASLFETCPQLSGLLRNAPQSGLVLDSDVSTELFLTENFGSSSLMVRREAIEAVGAFDESLRASEDYDFQYRIATAHKIGVIPAVHWFRRLHAASMSSNAPNILHFKIVTRARILEYETVPRRRRMLKRALEAYHLGLAFHWTGRRNGLAVRYVLRALKYHPWPRLRHFARIVADVLGRDTHGTRVGSGDRRLAGSN
jgi:glycosyltransferase involved in cell wall biosynthesis